MGALRWAAVQPCVVLSDMVTWLYQWTMDSVSCLCDGWQVSTFFYLLIFIELLLRKYNKDMVILKKELTVFTLPSSHSGLFIILNILRASCCIGRFIVGGMVVVALWNVRGLSDKLASIC